MLDMLLIVILIDFDSNKSENVEYKYIIQSNEKYSIQYQSHRLDLL